MKHILLTTIAAVVLVGCGNPEADRALLEAARDGNIEAVRQHLAAGADVNAKNDFGWTPLHQVATKEIAELLIAEGAEVNVNDRGGSTPLHNAVIGFQKEVAELLIANGANESRAS
jgi:ankyrin repeat protein